MVNEVPKEKDAKESDNLYLTRSFDDMKALMGPKVAYVADKGYCVDHLFKNIIYLPEYVDIELSDRTVTYKHPETGKTMVMKI